MEPYDSPTFLGNKDKLLLGMTIRQIGVFMGSGLLWLMIALAAEFSTLKSLLIFGPAHALTVSFFMVKLSGLALPMYLLAMLSSLVASAVYQPLVLVRVRVENAHGIRHPVCYTHPTGGTGHREHHRF